MKINTHKGAHPSVFFFCFSGGDFTAELNFFLLSNKKKHFLPPFHRCLLGRARCAKYGTEG